MLWGYLDATSPLCEQLGWREWRRSTRIRRSSDAELVFRSSCFSVTRQMLPMPKLPDLLDLAKMLPRRCFGASLLVTMTMGGLGPATELSDDRRFLETRSII
mmetsp:Transcript_26840/g.78445  ORF Transcript_26840/g.78445 Transcript_26840/m.78445 type:complete len:102 (-) Transcript_26840:492-797(-)